MHAIRRLLAAASVVAMTGGLGVISAGAAAAATAQPVHQHHATTATAVVSLPTSPVKGGGGNWAFAKVTRTITVTRVARVNHHVYKYSALVTDKGTFVTIRGALTPNQLPPFAGRHIHGVVSGTVYGKTVISFLSNARYPVTPKFVFGASKISPFMVRQFMGHHGFVFGFRTVTSSTVYHANKGFMRTWITSPTAGPSGISGNITGTVRHHHHH